MNEKLYLETSAVSYYTSRPSNDIHSGNCDPGRTNGGIKMWRDPIVEETRKNAEKLAASVDYDKTRFIENLRKNQSKSKKRIVSFRK